MTEFHMTTKKAKPTTHKIGEYFLFENGELCVLACSHGNVPTNDFYVAAIFLNNGNRFRNAVKVSDINAITPKELAMIINPKEFHPVKTVNCSVELA